MGLQDLIDRLLPKDEKFFALLERHAEVLGEAAKEMANFPTNDSDAAATLERVHDLEHRGDELVREVTLALDETFVTPIDREDIYSLASSIDNVLDNFYGAAQAFVAYEVHTLSPAMREIIQLCAEAALLLKDAVPLIRRRQLELLAPARHQIVALEKRGDAVYQNEMGALYKNSTVDAKELLRQQAVLDALEAALDSCQDAADVLENVAIKHS
jgi:uncharacterized protein Yka (UPF0111/DUF47 family)